MFDNYFALAGAPCSKNDLTEYIEKKLNYQLLNNEGIPVRFSFLENKIK
jgi:hypothetical protein